MSTANVNFNSKVSNKSFLNNNENQLNHKTKRAEKIAWIIFFGLGVSYFVSTLLIAIF